ncbi:hypothetical protein HNR23_003861 [Nocardiopsis mwathae]|uniref:Uncharacterized protein n=1 Tax=Nocardiopsis mwathae TaxID=1472723 RepID=A0A7W9YM92_9ACTN|nr:hypothetical protein [Nocardiopsis mwathae]MBB6173801.1 hypothetical protein [Nocardiopsis mwathae]
MFCGELSGDNYTECVAQMQLFAVASLIPAMLAMILMVAAFVTPAMRRNSELRARTLVYALIAWGVAGFTYVLGGLPSF